MDIDWHGVFVPSLGLAEVVVRGTLMYLALFVILRFVGRRQAGHFGPAARAGPSGRLSSFMGRPRVPVRVCLSHLFDLMPETHGPTGNLDQSRRGHLSCPQADPPPPSHAVARP
jgi:hypothetical protein